MHDLNNYQSRFSFEHLLISQGDENKDQIPGCKDLGKKATVILISGRVLVIKNELDMSYAFSRMVTRLYEYKLLFNDLKFTWRSMGANVL